MHQTPDLDQRLRTRLVATVGNTFASLRTRNFRLIFIGQTLSNTGNWLTTVALTLLVLHLTHSGLAIGLITAAQYGPLLLFSISAGAIADRHNKRSLLFVTQGLEMAESITLAFLAFMHHPPLAALYATAAVGGDSAGARQPAPPLVRHGDGPRGGPAQRRRALQPDRQRRPHLRASPGRAARGHRRLWLVLQHRRRLLSGRPDRPVDDAAHRTAPHRRPAPSQGRDPCRSALCRRQSQHLDFVRHAWRRRDAR